MGKALEGAAMIAGAVGLGVLAFFDPAVIAIPGYAELMYGLALGGISMEAGAIASALTSNRGQNITTRQAAGFRQIIYGTQRVGGVEIWRSTTGSSHDQFNYVIVLATHPCWEITNLYLDGRQVYFNTNSANGRLACPSGNYFGGYADGNDHTGPNGVTYNFSSKDVYCEARYGYQPDTDIMESLNANDPTWNIGAGGTPSVMGCTYVYLKVGYNPNNFSSEPEIRLTMKGKQVLDPRSGETTYSSNWALIVNDIITDPMFGLGDPSVNQAQLVAAANVCDEQVVLAGGGTESRYAASWHYDTSTAPGDAIANLMPAAAGRLSRIGGEWYIWPAYYQGPSASFNADHLTSTMQWVPYRAYRELINRVTGTYTAPNYPYNVAGDLYDQNGFAYGQMQNNFEFAFQPTNYPQFACDVLHGYAADQYFDADGGHQLPKELGLPAVLSVSQAQRIAKITLLRNRQQGTGQFPMSLAAYQLQPCDTFQMTFQQNGWTNKLLEVTGVQFILDSGGQGKSPQIGIVVSVGETDASVYEWNPALEEETVYALPVSSVQAPKQPAPPTNLALASLVQVQPDGSLVHSLEVTWDTPQDIYVTQIQVQYQLVGASAWVDGGTVSSNSNAMLISVISGQNYNVQIRSIRSSGATSVWVSASEGAAVAFSPALYQGSGVDPQALAGQANAITIQPFQVTLGSARVSYYPNGATISGLTLSTLYYVYTVDPTYAGGTPTPIATTDQADYLNQVGFILIGSVTTAA